MSLSPQTFGLIIGGCLPAVIYGFTGLFSKASIRAGIDIGTYLLIIGAAIMLTGVPFSILAKNNEPLTLYGGLFAAGVGLTWGLGTGLIAIGLSRYSAPLGKLVPLYNMNTLVAVLLALWVFAEWKDVQVTKLLLGSALIIIGGTLVARA